MADGHVLFAGICTGPGHRIVVFAATIETSDECVRSPGFSRNDFLPTLPAEAGTRNNGEQDG
jgi:hypothetical protein